MWMFTTQRRLTCQLPVWRLWKSRLIFLSIVFVSWLEIPVTCVCLFFRRRCVLHQLIFQVFFLLMIKEQTGIVHFASSSTESLLQEQQDWSQLHLDADTRPVSSHRVCVRLRRSIVCKPGRRDVCRSDRKGEEQLLDQRTLDYGADEKLVFPAGVSALKQQGLSERSERQKKDLICCQIDGC